MKFGDSTNYIEQCARQEEILEQKVLNIFLGSILGKVNANSPIPVM